MVTKQFVSYCDILARTAFLSGVRTSYWCLTFSNSQLTAIPMNTYERFYKLSGRTRSRVFFFSRTNKMHLKAGRSSNSPILMFSSCVRYFRSCVLYAGFYYPRDLSLNDVFSFTVSSRFFFYFFYLIFHASNCPAQCVPRERREQLGGPVSFCGQARSSGVCPPRRKRGAAAGLRLDPVLGGPGEKTNPLVTDRV